MFRSVRSATAFLLRGPMRLRQILAVQDAAVLVANVFRDDELKHRPLRTPLARRCVPHATATSTTATTAATTAATTPRHSCFLLRKALLAPLARHLISFAVVLTFFETPRWTTSPSFASLATSRSDLYPRFIDDSYMITPELAG